MRLISLFAKSLPRTPSLLLILSLIGQSIYSQSFTKQTIPGIGTIDNRALIAEDLDNNSMPDLFFPNRTFGNNYFFKNYSGNLHKQSSSNTIVSNSASTAVVITGDPDGDCDLDLYFANGAGSRNTNQLFELTNSSYTKNAASGTTSRNRESSGANWVDIDKDGDLDLYVLNFANQKNEYYQNSGNISFTEVDTLGFTTNTAKSAHGTFRDFDGDGDLDLFVANGGGANNTYFRNDDTTFLSLSTGNIVSDGGNSFTASTGDYDNDGDEDIFVGNTGFQKNFLYRNDTNGFTKITSGAITSGAVKSKSSAWFDMDNDGDLDLIVGNKGQDDLYRNDGNGNFTSVNAGNLTSDFDDHTGLAIADIDRNGTQDIVASVRNGVPVIYYNNDTSNNYINLDLSGTGGKATANHARVRLKANISGNGSEWITRIASNIKGRNSQSTHKAHFGLGSATTVDSLVIKWVTGKTCTFTNLAVNGFFNVKPGGCTMDTVLHSEFEDSTSALNVFFTNKSSSSATSYHWDFGDGDASNQKNPQHRYSTPGTYTVSLTTEDNYCKWDSVVKVISVCGDSANPGFTVAYNNLQLNFSDTTNSIVGHSTSWDFGDGITGTGKNVQHVYQSTGTYQVCLTVDDSCHTYTVCDSIQVCDSLQTGFGYSLVGKKITLTDSSNGTTVKYLLGDGSSANRANISYNYAQGGYYDVCQIVSNACVTDTLCKRIGVCVDTAVSAFSHSATNKQVSFSSNNSQNAKQYFWDFGDGNTSTQANPTHLYQSFQTYNVCLIVSNNCFSDTTCKTIDICPFAPGVAGFNYSLLGIPNGVKFNQQAQNAISYQWDFGDGGSSTNPNPSHVFPRKDTFNVCLTITDSCNNQDTDCQIVDLVNVS